MEAIQNMSENSLLTHNFQFTIWSNGQIRAATKTVYFHTCVPCLIARLALWELFKENNNIQTNVRVFKKMDGDVIIRCVILSPPLRGGVWVVCYSQT